jgi:SagB-type dehydrogenase family enzyme
VSSSLRVSLREGLSIAPGGEGELVLHRREGPIVLAQLTSGIRTALQKLAHPGEHDERLTALVVDGDGPGGLEAFRARLQHLARQGLLVCAACADGKPLATLEPTSPFFELAFHVIIPERRYQLSRFAYTRRDRSHMILESPLAHARIVLHDCQGAALVHLLVRPTRLDELGGQISALPDGAAAALMALLVNANLLWELNEHGMSAEDESTALKSWEFHDLLFHARSRGGRHAYPWGGTYRFVGQLDPPPVVKPVRSGESVDLYRPDLDTLQREDPPFAQVQEARRSIRKYAATPISDRHLGEFLYRTGRLVDYWENEIQTPQGAVRMSYAPRPYPAGGALYELEMYAVVNLCQGLAPGLYYYDPEHHRLVRLSDRTVAVDQLLAEAARSTATAAKDLQVLIVLTARFQRLAWKYAGIAYALILKHVGVLQQTMYLAATAMGLAPCAVGGGNADLFARAAGTDYYEETSVGEFLLGSKA